MTGSSRVGMLPDALTAGSGGRFAALPALPKVCSVLGFAVLTVSFGRYAAPECTAVAVLPFLLSWGGGVPVGILLRRAAAVLPLVLCTGAADVFLDRAAVTVAGFWTLPGGWVSLWVLCAKALGTTGMVLLLAATTPLSAVSGALTRLGVPCLIVLQLQMLFRYLALTVSEAGRLADAYRLRNPAARGIPVRDWGMLFGRLFLRTVGRGDAVYRAMQCRLFRAGAPLPRGEFGSAGAWCVCCVPVALAAALRWGMPW